jgi:hypothetical protein
MLTVLTQTPLLREVAHIASHADATAPETARRMIASHHLIAADYGRRVMGITRGTISERDIRRQRNAPPQGASALASEPAAVFGTLRREIVARTPIRSLVDG